MSAEKTVSQQKREAILEAAVTEFEANGFQATSMDRIADSAQVSKRTVYNHFPSKEILFQAITDTLWEQVAQIAKQPYDPGQTLEQQLYQIGEHEMALLTSQCITRLARVTLTEYSRSPELARTAYDNFRNEGCGLIGWIRQAKKAGVLDIADPKMAADQFLALIKTFAFWPQMFGGQDAPGEAEKKKIIQSAVDMFLRSYAANN